jgi:hypothetical protein
LDLERLRAGYLPTLGPIETDTGTDYRYRARVSADDLAAAVARLVGAIDYANFKNEVSAR